MSRHPGVKGREAELRALTDAVRRLVDLTVNHVASPEETAEIASALHGLADRLETHVPAAPLPRFLIAPEGVSAPMADGMPFDVVIGPYSPLALPVEIEIAPPLAIGHARFTTPYEGPPGCVHGGVIAQVFDIVLSAANRLAEAAGPTGRLTVRYRRPTLLHHDVRIEAQVIDRKGRRTRSTGRMFQGGHVTAEAEGLFFALDHADVAALHKRNPVSKG